MNMIKLVIAMLTLAACAAKPMPLHECLQHHENPRGVSECSNDHHGGE
jgi:hypothetical protein